MSSLSSTSPSSLIREFLATHRGTKLVDASSLLSELEIDSLELLECLFELEQLCDRTLTNTELASLTTVADLIEIFTPPHRQLEG